jgi:hypothetical protein
MATPWQVPVDLWKGKTVAILASGPSLSAEQVELVRAHKLPCIAINNSVVLAPWADALFAADVSWWCRYQSVGLAFQGLKTTTHDSVPFEQVKLLRPTGFKGYDHTPGTIRTGINSGYQATHVAMQAGASRILLLGVDMSVKHGVHWHGSHPEGMSNPDERILPRMREYWETLVPHAKLNRVAIYNCSPISELECFPKVALENCIETSRLTPA